MAVVRKKQDDKNLKILREIVTTGAGNRQCFDCGQKGPTYVNMTIGSFVCTRCSGVLRGLTPPHRVKSISMATFTPEEIEFLKLHGNDFCGKTWLGLWDPKRIIHQDQRELMIDKYERKRYYLEPASPLKSLTTAVSSTTKSSSSSSSSSNINNNLLSNGNTNYNNISNNCNNSQQLSNGGTTSSNSSSSLNSINSNKFIDNSFKNISLTPPTSSRLHNGNRQINGFNDDNNIFMNGHTNNNSHHQPRPIVVNKASLNISSSLDSSSSNNSLNGFTPDSDFIADFNTANIFNATTTVQQQNNNNNNATNQGPIRNGNNFINNGGNHIMNGFGNNNNNTLSTTNNINENFADFDHAPIYNAAVYENNVIQDCNSFATNLNNLVQNNSNTTNSNVNSNITSNNSINNVNSTVQQQQQQKQPTFYSQNNSNLNNINLNRSDNDCTTSMNPQFLGNNFTNSNIMTTLNDNTNSNNSYYNQQWNNWQQFQWPPPLSSSTLATTINSSEQNNIIINSNIQQQQNRWSLPISARSNSLSSSATNLGLNSTPPADRYAALKDLDEQLRETKVSTTVTAVTTEPFINGSTVSNANPFNTPSPSMPIQQNQQQIANPFQVTNTNNGNGLFGSPQQQQNMLQQQHQLQQQNLLQQQQQQQLQMQQQMQIQHQQQLFNNGGGSFGTNTNFGLFNFNNGNDFNNGNVNGYNHNNNNNNNNNMAQQQPTMISTGANGCGMMGFGGAHQITAGSSMSNMKNPFTTTSVLNSNNPFL